MHLNHHRMHSQLYCASQGNHRQNKMNQIVFQTDLLSFHSLYENKMENTQSAQFSKFIKYSVMSVLDLNVVVVDMH